MGEQTSRPFIDAVFGKKPSRYPIWFMRQAGRYLPEYMQVRSKVDFLELCQTPQLAAEVTLQPLRRYDLDASIIFADILLICTAVGQELTFDKGHGPRLTPPVRTEMDVKGLRRPNVEKDLGYVGEAIGLVKKNLAPGQAMIGFAGAPFTVASYMIEGAGSKNFTEVKKLAYGNPAVLTRLLNFLGEVSLAYLQMQVAAGADAVMLFDTWAGQLPSDVYRELVLPATGKLIASLKAAQIPVIYFPGQGSDQLFELRGVPMDAVSVDWRTPIDRATEILRGVGVNASVQGNLDPLTLLGTEAFVRARTRDVLQRAKKARAHVFNVGHGLIPETPPESLLWVVDEVRKFSS